MVDKDKTIRTLLNKFVNDIPEHGIGWAKNYLEEALEERESKLVLEAERSAYKHILHWNNENITHEAMKQMLERRIENQLTNERER